MWPRVTDLDRRAELAQTLAVIAEFFAVWGTMKFGTSAAGVRAIFGNNLKELAAGERSMADLARKLGLNRTQLHRFMDGSAFPRPDVLAVICDYFKVDARIFTTPLAELAKVAQSKPNGLSSYYDEVFEPVSHQLLPDGMYNEWKFSLAMPGQVAHHLLLVYTKNGRRYLKVKEPDHFSMATGRFRFALPLTTYYGEIFAQRNGFATIDRAPSQKVIALTSFRVGYSFHEELYPGYKLAGASYNRQLMHAHNAVILERLPKRSAEVLAMGRVPLYRSKEDTPPLIRRVLDELQEDLPNHLSGGPGPYPNAHGGVPD